MYYTFGINKIIFLKKKNYFINTYLHLFLMFHKKIHKYYIIYGMNIYYYINLMV